MEMMTLSDLQGVPVRVTWDPGAGSASPPLRSHGTVYSVSTSGEMVLELLTPLPAARGPVQVGVEILHPDGLIKFTSRSWGTYGGTQHLHVVAPEPDRLEWLQRRRHLRVAVRLACQLRHPTDPNPAHVWHGVTQNLSAGGASVEVQALLVLQDRIYISFPGSVGLPVSPILADVVRIHPGEAGQSVVALRFVNVDPQCEHKLQEFVAAVDRRQRLPRARRPGTLTD